jgi:hypothetical protein
LLGVSFVSIQTYKSWIFLYLHHILMLTERMNKNKNGKPMKLAFYAAKLSFLVCLHYKTELKFLIRAVWSCKTKKTARLWAFLEEFAMWGCCDVGML